MSVGLNVLLGHGYDACTAATVPRMLHDDVALMHVVEHHVSLARPKYPALSSEDLNPRRWVFKFDDLADGQAGGGSSDVVAEVEARWSTERIVHLDGPALLVLDMGRHACDLGTPWRWWTLTEVTIYASVRGVVRELARLLESPAALYVPDSAFAPAGARELVLKGATLPQIDAWLHERYGSPASDPATIISPTQNKNYRFAMAEHGYLKETFR